ncbi:MAG: hypothetical protein KQH53_08290 [Desulfarculaceae bacterium]|nr:hypothetical protein [Desulfarculaceae bacterium]
MQSLLKGEVLRSPLRRPLRSSAGLVFDVDPARGNLVDLVSGQNATNGRGTERTVIRGGRVRTVGIGQVALSDRYGKTRIDIQPAATNLLTHSEAFDNAAWSKVNCIVSANAIGGPDGNTTADKIEFTGQDYPRVKQTTSQAADGITVTLSAWLRGDTDRTGRLEVSSNGTSTGGSQAISITTNWQRFHYTVTMGAGTGTITPYIHASYATNQTGHVYIWGAQLEAGQVPTAYIPTVASPVSRAADAVGWTLPQALKNILSTAEGPAAAQGTLVVRGWVPEFNHGDITTACSIIGASDATASLLYYQDYNPLGGGLIRAYDGINGALVVNNWVAGKSYDLAERWSAGLGLSQVGHKLSSWNDWIWGDPAPFDGSFALGSYLNLGYSPTYPFEIGSTEFHEKWLEDPR